ncbi:hypothetical protein QAD02_000751 [Eretmocerus hayati]|uniref:Uncharacterized protein n=1 Tax=Eretmocerus hayati TaxID=131215 RepID=A0ACC2NGY3_9HYME|nr:hypothetical protein QAD02_000751 [Eretmocerus hayati]
MVCARNFENNEIVLKSIEFLYVKYGAKQASDSSCFTFSGIASNEGLQSLDITIYSLHMWKCHSELEQLKLERDDSGISLYELYQKLLQKDYSLILIRTIPNIHNVKQVFPIYGPKLWHKYLRGKRYLAIRNHVLGKLGYIIHLDPDICIHIIERIRDYLPQYE